MAGYRKLGRTSSQRKALLRIQATNLLYHGKIVTTEARAKEVRKIVESLIALAVKEKDNFETVKVTAKVARKDADGKRVKEVVDGKKVTVYDEVEKEIKKDMPSRLHARRQMVKALYDVTEVPTAAAGKKKNTKKVDLTNKLFNEIAPKYASRNGGYTRIIKIGQRKGDGAMAVLIELVYFCIAISRTAELKTGGIRFMRVLPVFLCHMEKRKATVLLPRSFCDRWKGTVAFRLP